MDIKSGLRRLSAKLPSVEREPRASLIINFQFSIFVTINYILQQCHLPNDLAHVGGGEAKLMQYALEASAVTVGHFELIDYDVLVASALGVDVLQELTQLALLLEGLGVEGVALLGGGWRRCGRSARTFAQNGW